MEEKKEITVWQLAGGPVDRPYVDIFLKHGVGLIGPGDPGKWTENRNNADFSGRFVRQFANEVREGHVFLLRKGLATICAVGVVADSEYQYLNRFDDVNGWDLQHCRRVRWCKLPQEYSFKTSLFGANPPRFSRVWNVELLEYAEKFMSSPPIHWQSAPLPGLPLEEAPLDRVPSELHEVVAVANDLVPLMWDNERFGDHPSEDELLTHLVVPFFKSLGWTTECIGVKWHSIDVAIFSALPRNSENCHFVVEVKRLGAGVEGALEQAKGYVSVLGVSRDVIVTDGVRYRMYSAEKSFEPIAYANLVRLKSKATDFFSKVKRH